MFTHRQKEEKGNEAASEYAEAEETLIEEQTRALGLVHLNGLVHLDPNQTLSPGCNQA